MSKLVTMIGVKEKRFEVGVKLGVVGRVEELDICMQGKNKETPIISQNAKTIQKKVRLVLKAS